MKIAMIGGHLSPALSVIEHLPKETKMLFIGRKHPFEGDKTLSLEYKTIHSLGIAFAEITAGRLQRKFTRYTIISFLKFPIGIIQSFLILRKFKPDVVVGFGGYVSLSVALAAYAMRIPVVIHEQTLDAGLTNKIISVFAKKICISWDSSRKFFPREKTVLTGNPIRKFEVRSSPASPRGEKFKIGIDKALPTIYVTGGSSGSHFINMLIEGCIEGLLGKFNVIHQTGDSKHNDYDRLKIFWNKLSPNLRDRYILEKFIDPPQVGSILKNCNLVICRAGMNTITELLYFKKQAILIPLPFSQNNEQLKNAKFLERHGLGEVVLQNEIDSEKLYNKVVLMFENMRKYKLNKSIGEDLQGQDTVRKIIEVIEYVARQKKD